MAPVSAAAAATTLPLVSLTTWPATIAVAGSMGYARTEMMGPPLALFLGFILFLLSG
jgi:hypothetical protein